MRAAVEQEREIIGGLFDSFLRLSVLLPLLVPLSSVALLCLLALLLGAPGKVPLVKELIQPRDTSRKTVMTAHAHEIPDCYLAVPTTASATTTTTTTTTTTAIATTRTRRRLPVSLVLTPLRMTTTATICTINASNITTTDYCSPPGIGTGRWNI